MTTTTPLRAGAVAGRSLTLGVVAGAAILAFTGLALLAPSVLGLDRPGRAPHRFALASSAYLASHVVRCLRLALILHRPGLRFRQMARAHFLTAALGVIIPFKLSEVFRIREAAALRGSWRVGILTVWLERMLDAVVLALLLALALAGGGDAIDGLLPALAVLGGFALASFLVATVVPGNIRGLMLYLVRRPSGRGGTLLLRSCRSLLLTLAEVPRLVAGRLASLLLLSGAIWALELVALSVAFGLAYDPVELSSGLLAIVSTISVGVTVAMEGTEARLIDVLGFTAGVRDDADLYRNVLVLPLMVTASLLFLLLRRRSRRRVKL